MKVTIQVGSTRAAGAGTARPRVLLIGGTNRGRAVPAPMPGEQLRENNHGLCACKKGNRGDAQEANPLGQGYEVSS